MSRNKPSMAAAKADRLRKWGDDNDDAGADDDIFGGHDDFLAQLNVSHGEILSPIDETETLKVRPRARGLSPGAGTEMAVKKSTYIETVNSGGGGLARYAEGGDEGEGENEEKNEGENEGEKFGKTAKRDFVGLQHGFPAGGLRMSPGSASLTSPARRLSLGDYSEDTDTDITEMNEGDFAEIDDIFGKEESGIYSSGGTRASKQQAGAARAREVLLQRQQQLAAEARAEDADLFSRFQEIGRGQKNSSKNGQNIGLRSSFGGPFIDVGADADRDPDKDAAGVSTLKLRDLRLFENGVSPVKRGHVQGNDGNGDGDFTVRYEYTKDDFESFEDGFVGDLPAVIRPEKLAHFHGHNSSPEAARAELSRKTSMPVFPRSLKASRPTKFKSTMDLAGAFGGAEHPLFNPQNKIIRKLDRMPSFHGGKAGHTAPPEPIPESTPAAEDLLDYNMELRKKQLLEKYMEISERQFQLRSSPRKSQSQSRSQSRPKKGVGTVRYLNQAVAPHGSANKHMTYNVAAKTWEGNEHDLLRFEERDPRPSLITLQQFRGHSGPAAAAKGTMVYDPENLRWVNRDAVAEQQDDVFGDVPDLEPNDIPAYAAAASNSASAVPSTFKSKNTDRGVSTFTQRTVSTVSGASTAASSGTGASAGAGEEFTLNEKLMARFEKEEAKIRKKTHQWFAPDESYRLSSSGRHGFDPDYFWEIRKMVMDNDA